MIVQVDLNRPLPDLTQASAVEITARRALDLTSARVALFLQAVREQTSEEIPVGITAPALNAADVVDATIELDVDFYVADAQWTTDKRPDNVFPELVAGPAIGVIMDTVERLRHHCREEKVQVIYRGGIRGGADAGKMLCLGATAVSLGLSAIVGLGFRMARLTDEADLLEQVRKKINVEEATGHLINFAKSVNIEVTMLARACGKSSVVNMEPEDLRAISVAVSAATGVPMAGKEYNFRKPFQ